MTPLDWSPLKSLKSKTTHKKSSKTKRVLIYLSIKFTYFRFNLERQMIIDPHSALWESDLIVVVHDVSNEYSRDKLDSEVLKCLFAHPDKETILVLNKTDRLKNKSQLLDLVASLTGGRLNGKEFMTKKRVNRNKYTRNSLRDEEYEELFARTADKLNIHLPETKKGKKHEKVLALLDELKTCEEYLMKNQDRISLNGVDSQEIVVQDQNSQLVIIFLNLKFMTNLT